LHFDACSRTRPAHFLAIRDEREPNRTETGERRGVAALAAAMLISRDRIRPARCRDRGDIW